MWEPRRLTTIWASIARYRDSFPYAPYSLRIFEIIEQIGLHMSDIHDAFISLYDIYVSLSLSVLSCCT
jgi:hypothetical protein